MDPEPSSKPLRAAGEAGPLPAMGGSSDPSAGPAAAAVDLSVVRVNQLDAGVLDTELHSLLKSQLGRVCSGLPTGTLERFKPEVDALFNGLMFGFTVWVNRPTPGMHLQGLRYRNERSRLPSASAPALVDALRGVAVAGAGGARVDAGASSLASGWAGSAEGGGGAFGGGGGGGEGGASSGSGTGSSCSPSPSLPPGLSMPLPFISWGGGSGSGPPPTRTQRLLHGLLSVGVQWGFARLRRHGLVNGWGGEEAGSARRVAWQILGRLETLFRLAWMVNLLLFLRNGKYATPVDRLVQMRMVHDRPEPAPRPINYRFLNRRLLWDHWAKMAYVVAPLVDWGSVRRAVSGGAGRLRREARSLGVLGGGGGGALSSALGRGAGARAVGEEGEGETAAAGVVLTACVECGANPAKTPYLTSCGHVFCYYCARSACTVDPRYACPRCGECFATSRRWSQPR